MTRPRLLVYQGDSHEFLVILFGLTNAPTTFCNLMNDVFYDFLNKFVVVYLDESFKDLISPLELVLFRLIENQLYVKKEKCEFGRTVVMFLGH